MKIALVLPLLCVGVGMAQAAPDKFNVTPEEHAACDGDAAALCSAAYPSQDKLLACMKSHRADLSPACAVVFNAGLKRRRIPL